MSKARLIEPLVLPPDEFPPLPLDPGFAQLVQDDLGNVVTATDGFDAIVAEAIGIVDAIDGGLDALGGGLLEAFAEADLIDAKPVGDTVAGFTASLDPTSSAVDDLGTLLAGASGKSGGPGAGGAAQPITIGAATSPVLPCNATIGFSLPRQGSRPETGQVFFVNTDSTPVHITKLTLVQKSGGPFTAATDCTAAALAPGAYCKVQLILNTNAPAGTTAQLHIETDGPRGTVVLCGTVGAPTTGVAGGGHGAGGPILSNPPA